MGPGRKVRDPCLAYHGNYKPNKVLGSSTKTTNLVWSTRSVGTGFTPLETKRVGPRHYSLKTTTPLE